LPADYEFALLFYEPDVEIRSVAEAGALGLPERYRSHEGFLEMRRDYKRDMADVWIEPGEMIDLGDRIALRATVVGQGSTSGAETTVTQGYIYYFSPRGMIGRQDVYWRWDEDLSALESPE
jgi:hypothetical protein